MSHQLSLLDLLVQEGSPGYVHAMLPNMWFACGGTPVRNCRCGCWESYRPGTWVYRRTSTVGVTCPECITALTP